jgi:hypothetical protein
MWALEHFRFESLPVDLLNLWSRLVIMQLDYLVVISCLDVYSYSVVILTYLASFEHIWSQVIAMVIFTYPKVYSLVRLIHPVSLLARVHLCNHEICVLTSVLFAVHQLRVLWACSWEGFWSELGWA